MSTTNTVVSDLAHVPHPAGAVVVYDWEDVPSPPSRYVVGSSWAVERGSDDDLGVVINWTQWPYRAEYVITVSDVKHDLLDSLTAAQAHQLGAALTEAAFEMVRLAKLPGTEAR